MILPKHFKRGIQALLLALTLAPEAIGQEPSVRVTSGQPPTSLGESEKPNNSDLVQELDADSLAISQIPADPILRTDPLSPLLKPIDRLVGQGKEAEKVKIGATYTFLSQYATTVPAPLRHDQVSGRLDFTGVWKAYDRGSSAGSISLLVRSGANIGMSQPSNLSDKVGSGLYLNALQGGGPQEPITVNVLYWREDLLQKRISF